MKLTAPVIRGRKRRDGAPPIVMVTAYDEPGARFAAAAGVDLILVGDSLANVVLGQEDTLHVTIEEMCHHVRAVAAAHIDVHVVADMPWLSYHLSIADSVRNAAALVRSGADSVKLEGGRVRREVVRAILDAEIPVMGHLGLTPQSVLDLRRASGSRRRPARRLCNLNSTPRSSRTRVSSPSSSRACRASSARG